MTTPDKPVGNDPEAERIIADIEATRAELGDTVDALAGKLDVRAQARSQVDDARQRVSQQVETLRDRATDHQGNPTTQAKALAGAVAAALVGLVVLRRVRHRRQER